MKWPVERTVPSLNGLVLAGGKSTRLGVDKTVLQFRGVPHRTYLARLLSEVCTEVFISFGAGQRPKSEPLNPILFDTYEGLGPFGALLTAFEFANDRAWFVLASDLPLFDAEAVRALIDQRDPRLPATAFVHKGFPEPLAAIWEPRALIALRKFHGDGNYSPTDVLSQTLIKTVVPGKPEWLLNLNTPEDLERVREIMGNDEPD